MCVQAIRATRKHRPELGLLVGKPCFGLGVHPAEGRKPYLQFDKFLTFCLPR
jgi:hypothetical protein